MHSEILHGLLAGILAVAFIVALSVAAGDLTASAAAIIKRRYAHYRRHHGS